MCLRAFLLSAASCFSVYAPWDRELHLLTFLSKRNILIIISLTIKKLQREHIIINISNKIKGERKSDTAAKFKTKGHYSQSRKVKMRPSYCRPDLYGCTPWGWQDQQEYRVSQPGISDGFRRYNQCPASFSWQIWPAFWPSLSPVLYPMRQGFRRSSHVSWGIWQADRGKNGFSHKSASHCLWRSL